MSNEKIIVRFNDTPRIVVHFGEQGLRGDGGVTNHNELSNLGYGESNHAGFQSKLMYIAPYKAYEVNDN
jgi:hypothetical protein